jgi:ribosomal protein S18 acetylase RimI-like enzyme
MKSEALRIVEITRLDDDLLLPWLDLYETAFPVTEKVLVSSFLRKLRGGEYGPDKDEHVLAIVNGEGALVAMAQYEVEPACQAAYLWYLAVLPACRNGGIGSWCYQQLAARIQAAGAGAILLEVEIPEEAHTEMERGYAKRRIGFYRRLGARLLTGIRYYQHVGSHQPPIPMHLLVHPFAPITADGAFALARGMFGESVELVGELGLD